MLLSFFFFSFWKEARVGGGGGGVSVVKLGLVRRESQNRVLADEDGLCGSVVRQQ